jgi:hypothetical protein
MSCGDVEEDGVKRLVEVPLCRCRRRDVDVGAVLLGTNKARKNRNPNTHVNAQKFGAKRTHKSCQNLCLDNAEFCAKGYYDVKTESRWMYAGFSRFGPALAGVVSRAAVGVLAGRWRWADRAELLGAGRAEAAKVRGASAMVAGLGRALGGIGCELGVGVMGGGELAELLRGGHERKVELGPGSKV